MTVDQLAYRGAMAKLGTAVSVITTSVDGFRDGFTASAVCSVTDTPPTLLVCINRSSRSRDRFVLGGPICVNVLSGDQRDISSAFSGKLEPEEKFAVGHWDTLRTSAPVLRDASVNFDCIIRNITEVGSHSILFCEVEAVAVAEVEHGLIYLNRAYHILPHNI